MYEMHAVLGAVALAAAGGAVVHALVGRHARGWSAVVRVDNGAYRSAEVVVPRRAPLVVRVASGLAALGVGIGALRVAMIVPELIDLVDQPHVLVGLVPASPLLALFHFAYGVLTLASAIAFGSMIRGALRRERLVQPWSLTIVAACLPFALADAWLVHETCRAIYWTNRMSVLSLGHATVILVALITGLLAARRAQGSLPAHE
jgi:hypothetical protein